MKIVKQSHQVIDKLEPLQHIEKIGRICYKSEDKITTDSASKFVNMLCKNRHYAMLEHYRFIMQVQPPVYNVIASINAKYFEHTNYNNRMIISFSIRGLLELDKNNNAQYNGILNLAVLSVKHELASHICRVYTDMKFIFNDIEDPIVSSGVEFIPNSPRSMTNDEYLIHGWKSVLLTTDRGISHELVRHRLCSFAQESTRYCNYGKDRFGGIKVIDQGFDNYIKDQWIIACKSGIDSYTKMISNGVSPQMARSVLPTCLKTDIVITTNIKEWNYIFQLRVDGVTGKPHPLVTKLLKPVKEELEKEYKYNESKSINS